MFPSTYNLPQEVIAAAQQMLKQMQEIRNSPLPPDDELPEMTEKQKERLEAFELRNALRREQGRAV